ncbi:MAG TPA: PspC domain-containing protein [Pseudonocardia sp.]|jgi:phage shock protein PspC (stress-responsive transcriptional regulator)|uniref:PspC domain-containing protein n=1 Tax=Pseudonocardia sp. TaxID=60912 RepID=UPI002F3FF8E3
MSPTTEPRATLQAIWQTRPSRRQADRKVAGVAAAIGRRYELDPVLVRIGFVVAAVYGVGIVLYLAAWATLPVDPADPPTGPLRGKNGGTSVHPIVLVAAGLAGLGAIGSLLRGDPGVLVGFAVIGGLAYLLHQSRGARAVDAPTHGAVTAGAVTAGAAEEHTGDPGEGRTAEGHAGEPHTAQAPEAGSGQAERTTEPQPRPPAWDPLGVAPFAWDLPEPRALPPDPVDPPRRRRSRLTMVTIALALLGGAIAGAVSMVADGPGVRLVAGVMLAVVGLGLVVGSFLHRGRGLILLAVPLMLLAYGSTRVQLTGTDWRDSGDLRIAPTSASQLAPSYARGFGTVELDLRKLDLAAPVPPVPPPSGPPPAPGLPAPPAVPAPAPIATRISMQAGDVTVWLPADADVTVHCHADVGAVSCLGPETEGGPMADAHTTDLGAGGKPGGRPLSLDITVGAGSVSVHRG